VSARRNLHHKLSGTAKRLMKRHGGKTRVPVMTPARLSTSGDRKRNNHSCLRFVWLSSLSVSMNEVHLNINRNSHQGSIRFHYTSWVTDLTSADSEKEG
jgi:hypothetical protein